MTLRELIGIWERSPNSPKTDREYTVKLSKQDAAKLAALEEMYPSRTKEQLITELLTAALHELEYTLPYIQGDTVSTLDELGDPIYEDIGPTGRFKELTQKHLRCQQQH